MKPLKTTPKVNVSPEIKEFLQTSIIVFKTIVRVGEMITQVSQQILLTLMVLNSVLVKLPINPPLPSLPPVIEQPQK